MIDFISTNIGWVKDSFTTIFAITGTVLAILTYRRARYTILQPIRNEVIKKQSELLTNLLRILVIPITYSGFIRSPDHPNAWGVMLSV